MPFKILALPILVGLMACFGGSAALRADDVQITIVNRSKSKWTLKAPVAADIALKVFRDGSTTALSSRSGSEPKTAYYDLAGETSFVMSLTGRKSTTQIEFPFSLGGENKNYKTLRAFREVPKSNFIATSDVNVEGTGYQKLLSAPMLAIVGEDTVVTTGKGKVIIAGNNYPTR
jgi:hypothetical protein